MSITDNDAEASQQDPQESRESVRLPARLAVIRAKTKGTHFRSAQEQGRIGPRSTNVIDVLAHNGPFSQVEHSLETEDELDIRQYVRTLAHRWPIILLAIVVCAAAAAAFSLTQPKEYTATAKLLISAQQDIASTGTGALSDPNGIQNQIQTQVQVVKSPQVEQIVNQALGADAAKVVSIAASGVTNTRVLSITATSKSPDVAKKAADAYSDAYLQASRQNTVNRVAAIGQTVQQKKDDLQKQIDGLNGQLKAKSGDADSLRGQISALQSQITQLQTQYTNAQAAALVRESTAEPLEAAQTPSAPSSPNPKRNIALALVLGTLLGIGIALLIERLDDRIRSKERLAQWFPGITVLGSIPRVKEWKNQGEARVISLQEPQGPVAEAYRSLRTSLEFINLDHNIRVLDVTSATDGEGKSTTVANLAAALSWAGQNVVVVAADLRRPRIHEFYGLPNDIGLTTVLLGMKPLDEALIPVSIKGGIGRVELLPTGPLPPNPSEVLSSQSFGKLMDELRASFDYVLLDAPPVLPVSDPLVLSKYADGILLIAGADSLHRTQLNAAFENIVRGTNTPLLGIVLNKTDRRQTYAKEYSAYTSAAQPTMGSEPMIDVTSKKAASAKA